MTTFDETDHPRNHPTGRTRFSEKEHSTPEALLDPDKMTIAQISDEVGNAGWSREFDLGVSAVKQIVFSAFPTAAEIEVWNPAEEDDDLWLAPRAIRDAHGKTLWDADSDWESVFFEELSEWTPLLDRMGSAALFQPGTAADPEPWLGLKTGTGAWGEHMNREVFGNPKDRRLRAEDMDRDEDGSLTDLGRAQLVNFQIEAGLLDEEPIDLDDFA